MKRELLLSFAFLLCFSITSLFAYVDYAKNTAEGITVAIDPQPGFHFEWRLKDEDRDIWYDLYKGPSNSIFIERPRSGHYTVWVRACLPGEYNDNACSEWTYSSDDDSGRAVRLDGTPGGWRIFWKPLPPKFNIN